MEIPRHWRLKPQRYQLIGSICPECQTKHFPPREICPEARKNGHTPIEFNIRVKADSLESTHER